ncbi:hypothetical protein JP0074_06510 [Helicobacter pylori]|uniref:virB3 type IV secretion protein n=1 Tax=Helicobacter pylori TaxID=210 RepID=UPI001AA95BE1|nr:virB3 type IV secretion protein [Helicobacter pylori]GHQ62765.1 hypothetical protein JP0074_06510 [Helicobacter pylori]
MALHIVCVESINIREISKRETFLGLNLDSWIVSFLILGLNLDSWIVSFLMSAWLLSFQPLYAMGLMASCVFVFYILEFFDEYITAILHALFTLRTGARNYYA